MEIVDAFVQSAFSEDTDAAFRLLTKNRTRVFWVTWSQPDETIVSACETVLKTGQLSARRDDDSLVIAYGSRTEQVTLTGEPEDRHVTLLALNRLLAPHFEIRFVWESIGADAGAFLPLPCTAWAALETQRGEAVRRRVLVLTPELNTFTELTPRMKPESPASLPGPSSKPWWKFWG